MLNPAPAEPASTTNLQAETQDAQYDPWVYGDDRAYAPTAHATEPAALDLGGQTEQPSSGLVGTVPSNFAEDAPRYNPGSLPGIEPHLGGMFGQQEPSPLPRPATQNQLVDVLSPVVTNLHATSVLMGQMREDDEIDEIRRQHIERATDLTPLMHGPTGDAVLYYRLRTSDPFLINSVARLRERHLQIAHDLTIINSTDEIIQSLVDYRDSALRRMRDVDLSYGAIVEELVDFVRGQPTVHGTGWFHNVSQAEGDPWNDGRMG